MAGTGKSREPAGSRLNERILRKAPIDATSSQACVEYLGQSNRRPAFPMSDSYDVPGIKLMPAAKFGLPATGSGGRKQHGPRANRVYTRAAAVTRSRRRLAPFSARPEVTTPACVYLATRGGRLVWVRVRLHAPKVHQFTARSKKRARPSRRAGPASSLGRPNDDDHTTNFELAQWIGVGDHEGAVGRPGLGQSATGHVRRAAALSADL